MPFTHVDCSRAAYFGLGLGKCFAWNRTIGIEWLVMASAFLFHLRCSCVWHLLAGEASIDSLKTEQA